MPKLASPELASPALAQPVGCKLLWVLAVMAVLGLLLGAPCQADDASLGRAAHNSLQRHGARAAVGPTTGTGGGMVTPRAALVFKISDPYSDLRVGSLARVALGGQTALALRPRGGRLAVTLSSRW